MILDILTDTYRSTNILKKIKDYINISSEDILKKDIIKLRNFKSPIKIDIYLLIMKKYNSKNITELIDSNIWLDVELNIEKCYFLLEELSKIYKTKQIFTFLNSTIEKIVKFDDKIFTHILEYLINDNRKKIDIGCELYKLFSKEFNISKIKSIEFEREKVLKACRKISYIITVYTISSLKLFYKLDKLYLFTKEELDYFFKSMLFNYPYDCQKFIECTNDDNSYFIKYINEYIDDFKEKNKIKYSIKDILPSDTRINIYGKRKHQQAQEINKMSEKFSVFSDLFNTRTILYGKNININQDNNSTVSHSLKDLSYYYNIPIEYTIDPVLFYNKTESIIYNNDNGDKI